MFQYDMLARSLASGNGFRWYAQADLHLLEPLVHLDFSKVDYDPQRGLQTSFRAPLYPSFLALVYLASGIGGGRFFAARLAQTVLGALLAPLTYTTARRIFPDASTGSGPQAARLAAWTVAAYPMLLIFPLALATEDLFFLLVLASVAMLFEAAARPAAFRFLLSGLLLGLAALTRSVILPFVGLAILWTWFVLRQRRGALLMTLALAATIAPWIIRNSLLHRKLTGIETSLGYNLYVGYHPQSSGTFTSGPALDLLSVVDDNARDELGTQKAIEFIRQDPARFPYLALRRLGYFFNLELRAFIYFYGNDFFGFIPLPLLLMILIVLALPFVVLSLSAACGAPLLASRPQTTLLALLFSGYLLPHIFILSEERFHLTLIPFLAITAAQYWTHQLTPQDSASGAPPVLKRGRLVFTLSLLAVALLLLNWGLELGRDWAVLRQMLGPNGNHLYLPY